MTRFAWVLSAGAAAVALFLGFEALAWQAGRRWHVEAPVEDDGGLKRLIDFVDHCDPSILDAFTFTENNRDREWEADHAGA